ncbi:MAG: hypothetical protein QOE33_2433 [Acidobacteriota bacterium]|nr:hypothetical protein [Acidobacteriota bacterium]
MKTPFDDINGPFNDPLLREHLKRMRDLENNPAYQHAMREQQRLQNNPAYQFAIKEMERRQRDPAYRAMLQSLEIQRRQDYAGILRSIPDISQMQDLLKVSYSQTAIRELEAFNARFNDQRVELFFKAEKLRDQQNLLRTFEEIRQAQETYDSLLRSDLWRREELVRFFPPIVTPVADEVKEPEPKQVSAELFILDLQTKYEEQYEDLDENEQLVMYATFNGFTMEVRDFFADTFNRIRLIGSVGGAETVAVVEQSNFTIVFMKIPSEPQKPKRRIGFIIEREIIEEDDDN